MYILRSSMSGVAFYLPKKTEKALLGYNPVNDRIITIRIRAKPTNITCIQIYAPTSTADDDVITFYDTLQQTVDEVNRRDMVVLMGDFNAKVGSCQNEEENGNIGKYGLGERNGRGDRLIEFIIENELMITNNFFKQHKRRLYTWTTPDGRNRNKIDFILIPKRWRTSVFNAKTLPGADCGSDHELLSAKIAIKLR